MNPNEEKPKSPRSPKKLPMVTQWNIAQVAKIEEKQAKKEVKQDRAQQRDAKYKMEG